MMRRRRLFAAASAVAAVRAAHAAATRPVVLELFTSQGCSSCPPADALLSELARWPDVLPLAFHVTYWNRLGWVDPFSLDAAAERQRQYAAALGLDGIYTPQLIVDGQTDVIGSDQPRVMRAISEARAQATTSLDLSHDGAQTTASVGRGPGGAVLFVGYDAAHRTAVGRGENAGRTLLESNIVRSLHAVAWDGAPLRAQHAAAGERVAVLVQGRDGAMLAARAAAAAAS